MAFGFALWAAGAVLVLPIVSGGRAPAGPAALGVAISMLVWGLAIGILMPFVHRPLHESLEKGSEHAELGPSAAAGKKQPLHQQRQESGR
jgi:4-amino-4-deoxy-L-arabinose transferase-like glycosyltransferase